MSVLYLTYKAEEFKYLLGASSSGSKLDHHRQDSPSRNPQELFFIAYPPLDIWYVILLLNLPDVPPQFLTIGKGKKM